MLWCLVTRLIDRDRDPDCIGHAQRPHQPRVGQQKLLALGELQWGYFGNTVEIGRDLDPFPDVRQHAQWPRARGRHARWRRGRYRLLGGFIPGTLQGLVGARTEPDV
jgi:hypothetical protein